MNIVLPFIWSTDELLPRTNAILVNSWLSSFKVLAFCLGRLPLRESMTVPQITAVIYLPIFPKPPATHATAVAGDGHGGGGRLNDNAGSAASLACRWVAKLVGLGLVVVAITVCGDTIPHVLLHYLYALGLYFFVGFLMDGPGAVAVEALGLQLVPTFDAPWLSTSLADFWGRRWNITASSVLRTLVYDTIAEGRLVAAAAKPEEQQEEQKQPAAAVAPLATAAPAAHVDATAYAHMGRAAGSSPGGQPHVSPAASGPGGASGLRHESDAAPAQASESGAVSSSRSAGSKHSGTFDPDASEPLHPHAAAHPDDGTAHKRPLMTTLVAASHDEPRSAHAAKQPTQPTPPKHEPCCAPPATPTTVSNSTTGLWAPRSLLRRTLAVHASCLASGLFHEYAIWHVSGLGWHWKWTLFFYMQAPLMTLEGLGRRWLRRRGLRVPRLLANILTLAALEAMAYPLFFGFVETDTDLARRVVAAVSRGYEEVLQPLRPLLSGAAAALAGGGAGKVGL